MLALVHDDVVAVSSVSNVNVTSAVGLVNGLNYPLEHRVLIFIMVSLQDMELTQNYTIPDKCLDFFSSYVSF